MRGSSGRWSVGVAFALGLGLSGACAAPAPAGAAHRSHHRLEAPPPAPIPQIVRAGDRYALLVDGAPYIMLGAQVNNSSNWPAELPKVWPVIDAMDANTVEMPMAWEQIEPTEGQFDFSFLDTLLPQARAHHVHLVLLWFGTWKNNGPNYAPAWVKLDNARFPRVINAKGETMNSLSPLFPATLEADKTAFVALMHHLKQADPQRTVLMVQVENETGTYGAVRDHSPTGDAAIAGPVPDELVKALGKTPGTWAQVFGADADEFFHAWSVAHFVNQVAAAGKAEYPLPLYANAALRDPFKFQDPMSYSSGGPTWNVLDIWKAATPSLDVIGPDIYMDDYASYTRTLDQYSRPDNALFVPETGNHPSYARMMFEALGRRAIGWSVFGMDASGYSNYPLGALRIDGDVIAPFGLNYSEIAPMDRQIAALSFAGKVWGGAEPPDAHEKTINLGRWTAKLSFGLPQFGSTRPVSDAPPAGGALIAELGPNEYLVTGEHVRVSFSLTDPADPAAKRVIMDRVEEGHYENGQWVFDRLWNGDETDYGLNFTSAAQVLRVKLATY